MKEEEKYYIIRETSFDGAPIDASSVPVLESEEDEDEYEKLSPL